MEGSEYQGYMFINMSIFKNEKNLVAFVYVEVVYHFYFTKILSKKVKICTFDQTFYALALSCELFFFTVKGEIKMTLKIMLD